MLCSLRLLSCHQQADLADSCYINVKAEELVRFESSTAFQSPAIYSVKHGSDVRASNIQDLCFHACLTALYMPVDRG